MTPVKTLLAATALSAFTPLSTLAEAHMQPAVTADVASADDVSMGSVTINTTASGEMLVQLDLHGVTPGIHAVHIHETGACEAPAFKSAGGHLAEGKDHGVGSSDGPHPGDMPNVTVGDDDVLKAEVFVAGLTADMLNDDDGSAFVMHDGVDDYMSQPAGDAGSRVACGVFMPAA
jgi:Cu-Zn family superoxide dismutase